MPQQMMHTLVRPVQPADDMAALTALIHAAYAAHAANGLRYWATHQPVEDTRQRLAAGEGFVAVQGTTLVGTIVLRGPQAASGVALYSAPTTWSFCQFAVAPLHQGQGIGRQLHERAMREALAQGAHVMALDTAASATQLIGMYRQWGYEVCGECDWRPRTNYVSVLMSRRLRPVPS
jgi:GNAT superfamily N-acetyltransferase